MKLVPRSDAVSRPGPNGPEPADRDDATRARPPAIDVQSAALTALAVIAAVLMLQFARAMVIPIVLGILLSYALAPVVEALARLHVPRVVAAALVVAALVGAGGWLAYALRGDVNAVIEQLPRAARRARAAIEHPGPAKQSPIQQVQKAATEIQQAASAAAAPPAPPAGVTPVQVETPPFDIGNYLVWGSLGIAAAIAQLVLILFLVFFLLASGDLYKRKLAKIAGPTLTDKKITVQILDAIHRRVEVVMFAQLFAMAIVAAISWLAFRAVGLEQPAVWGIAAGVVNSIPYFGPVLVTAGAAVVAWTQGAPANTVLSAAAVAFLIAAAESFVLTRWLTHRAARMNAVAVFVGLLFWGWLWGVWGLLLAVPLMLIVKTVCDHVDDFKPAGELLGN